MKSGHVWLLSVLMLVVLVPQSNIAAQTVSESIVVLDPINITAQLVDDGTTALTIEAQVNNHGNDSVDTLPLRIDSLDVELITSSSESESMDATLIGRDRYTDVLLDFPNPIEPNSSRGIEIQLLVRDVQSVQSLDQSSTLTGVFTYYVRPNLAMANFTFTVNLPSAAILSEESAVPLYPSSDMNWTDGSSLSFSWITSELQPGQERVYIVKYQLESTSGSVNGIFIEPILFTLFGIALGGLLIVGVPKAANRLKTMGTIRIAGITQEEEALLDVIHRKGGSCAQKELYTEFDMSQSRVSLTLTNLEQRGLIRRIREGRVNMVYIVEEP
ncbi:MAG: helix-turn-helix transcriptional regulator [Candidatus Thorarchaeota archaeon]|jgi:uncharacterized membrane protein